MSTDTTNPAQHGGEHTPKRKRKKAAAIKVAALNITAFMDLTFNLLMFFVLTASFSAAEGVLPASLPNRPGGGEGVSVPSEPAEPTTAQQVVIILRNIGNDETLIQIEGVPETPKNFEELYTTLDGLRIDPKRGSGGVFKDDDDITIKPDRSVKWQAVVDAFNAVIRAKYKNVGFAPASN